MTDHDQFASLKPQRIIATLASLNERFRRAFADLINMPPDKLAEIRTSTGPVLDQVATATEALETARAALKVTVEEDFPLVPASVLGLVPAPVVTASGSAEQHLADLADAASGLIEELKAVPKVHWRRAAYANDPGGNATFEQMAQHAARTAIGALHQVEAAVPRP